MTEEQVEELVDWNMLQVRELGNNTFYSMHRLHQRVAQTGRSPQSALNAVHSMVMSFDQSRVDTWSKAVTSLPHVDALMKNVPEWPTNMNPICSEILSSAGNIQYHVQGDFDRALANYQKALKIHESVLGVNHPDNCHLLQQYWCPTARER